MACKATFPNKNFILRTKAARSVSRQTQQQQLQHSDDFQIAYFYFILFTLRRQHQINILMVHDDQTQNEGKLYGKWFYLAFRKVVVNFMRVIFMTLFFHSTRFYCFSQTFSVNSFV